MQTLKPTNTGFSQPCHVTQVSRKISYRQADVVHTNHGTCLSKPKTCFSKLKTCFDKAKTKRERVLFIGTQFSILYTSMYSRAKASQRHALASQRQSAKSSIRQWNPARSPQAFVFAEKNCTSPPTPSGRTRPANAHWGVLP